MDATTNAVIRFLALLLAFVGAYAIADGTLLLVLPEQLPAGELTSRPVLELMARQLAIGCGSLGLGALVLHRTRRQGMAEAAPQPDAVA